MRKTLIWLLVLGCSPGDDAPVHVPGDDDDDDIVTEPPDTAPPFGCPVDAPATDTIPSFCGEIPKNLLFLSIDTFRKPYLGRYGEHGVTPFLDGLVEEGFVLDDHAQCSNWTYASTTCTLLGRYNVEAGFMAKLNELHNAPVEDGTPFLATWLGEAGFHNILVSANSWLGPDWNNDQGYDVSVVQGPRVLGVWGRAQEELQAAIDAGAADRWFLHMHFLDPHSPYNPPDEYLVGYEDLPPVEWDLKDFGEHYKAIGSYGTLPPEEQALVKEHLEFLYKGEIAFTDTLLQQMWAELDAKGWLDDTLVVVWTDHGEAFWEHNVATHAHFLYGEENDGVAFFWAKNIVPGSWQEPTVATDLVPTVLSLFDLPIPSEVTGSPLGEAPVGRSRFGASYARNGIVQSVQKDDLKLQFRWLTGDLWLSDRQTDPDETVNLYDPAAPSADARALWDELLPVIQAIEPLAPEKTVTWPAELPGP